MARKTIKIAVDSAPKQKTLLTEAIRKAQKEVKHDQENVRGLESEIAVPLHEEKAPKLTGLESYLKQAAAFSEMHRAFIEQSEEYEKKYLRTLITLGKLICEIFQEENANGEETIIEEIAKRAAKHKINVSKSNWKDFNMLRLPHKRMLELKKIADKFPILQEFQSIYQGLSKTSKEIIEENPDEGYSPPQRGIVEEMQIKPKNEEQKG